MNPEQAVQWGIPGILVLVLVAVGRAASKLLDQHVLTMAELVKAVQRLDRTTSRIAEKLDVDSERPLP